ncbi:MAG: LysM peptidoglycan-binding domain-containing protein [Anaerolineae bacterium]|nr:LysM peptidoglycan-binding domain-containing protein [Anaerolineae bacterium]
MRIQRFLYWLILILFVFRAFSSPRSVQANENLPAPPKQTSAYEMILAMNTLRVSFGLPALVEDPIVNAVAQSTAATMAANNMSWHIGDVRGRLAAAGYGSGGTVWGTENFAMSSNGMGIDEIMAVWADPDHMRPAVTAAYCNVGAGVATVNGRTYYVLQAAYVSGQECGSSSSSGETSSSGTGAGTTSQLIVPVSIATSDADGKVYHIVQAGQSFWSIAIAYQISIRDLETWNNLSRESQLNAGQRLFIPNKDTEGYATPTPFGMFAIQTPDADGKIVHEVQAYQALVTIADAYHISVEQILALNGLQADWPLQIGQKLVISGGNITPSPTLTVLQRLTPEADGKYYHVVQSGETLSWIAGLYEVPLADLLNWNGLNSASVIRPGQKLLLLVTPPATPTLTPSPTSIQPSPLPTMTQSPPTATPPAIVEAEPPRRLNWGLILGMLTLFVAGWFLWGFLRKKNDALD